MRKIKDALSSFLFLFLCCICFGQQMSQSEMRKVADEFKTSISSPPNYSRTLSFPNKTKDTLIKAASDAIEDNLITRIKLNEDNGFAVKAMSLATPGDIQMIGIRVTAKDGTIKLDAWKFYESWNTESAAKDIFESVVSSLQFILN